MITDFEKRLNDFDVKYCFNEQDYDYSKLKFIIVGDNPGNNEFNEKKFFIGPSGKILRKHFSLNNLTTDFDNECIIFNKTFIHTTKTECLKEILNKIGKTLFEEIQKYCANEIACVSNKYNLPILIFGKSLIGHNLLFDCFWKSINKFVNKKENIWVFNHPSPPFRHFNKEWDNFKDDYKSDSSLKLLKRIGKFNAETINLKYKKFNTIVI
jgi:hypothetical protein